MEKTTLPAKGVDDTWPIGRLGEVASRPPRHEDFHPWLAVFLDQDDLATRLSRPRSSKQPGRSGSDYHNVRLYVHAE